MSFARYPAYKDSGVEWLGEMPGHWEVTKTKHVINFTVGWTPPTSDNASFEGDNLWANISDLGEKYLSDTSKRISDKAVQVSRITASPAGSLLFSFKLSIGQVSFASHDMYTNEAIATFLPSQRICLLYAFYAFPLFLVQNAAENIYGAKLLNQELIRSASFAIPGYSEQQAIATFLDIETAKIDGLMAEQRALVVLLKEKRQAVISHAVTKGLNPAAPMKDSGVTWLGEVPAHWEVCALKRDMNFLTSGSRGWSENYSENGALFIRIGNLTRDNISLDLSDIQRVQVPSGTEGERTRVQPGDVLFSITAYLGSVAVVPDGIEEAYVSQHVALVRLNQSKVTPVWAAYVAKSVIGKTFLETQGYGGTKVQLSLADVANVPMTLPPLREQKLIIDYLNHQTTQLDTLTQEAQTAITLLQERRTALISAAVTGKMDVRAA